MNHSSLKKILAAALCVCMTLPLLSGCGGGGKNDESDTGNLTESESKATDANETDDEAITDETEAEETEYTGEVFDPLPMPEKTENWDEVTGTEFSLLSPSTALSLAVKDDSLYIMSFKNPDTNYEWIDGESLVRLPEIASHYEPDGAYIDELPLEWVFKGAYTSDDNGDSLKLTFTNANPVFEIDSIWNVSGSDGPVQHTMYIRNLTDESYIIYPSQSLEIDVKSETDPEVWSFHKESREADGTGLYIEKLSETKNVTIKTTTQIEGNTSGFIPCAFFSAGTHGFYTAYEWVKGSITASDDSRSLININAGLGKSFMTVLNAGESFYVPTAYLGAYSGDVDSGSNIFKRWFFEIKVPDKLRDDEIEPYTQLDVQGYSNDHDLAAMGVQSIKWDYGWWSDIRPFDDWRIGNEGRWKLQDSGYYKSHLEKFGYNSIAEYGAALRDKGLNFTMYVLLHDAESTDPDALTSIGPNGHPEWFGNRLCAAGHSADLGNTDCVNWIKVKLLSFFEENNIYTWRTDSEPISYSGDKINRHVFNNIDTTYWCAAGFYEILDYLYEYRGGFRYENCGSGGALKDYATLSRSVIVMAEDIFTYNDIRTVFYTSSYAIHPAQIQAPAQMYSFVKESEMYIGTGDRDFGMRSVIMMAPHIGIPDEYLENGHFTEEDQNYITKYYNMFNEKIKPLVRHGDLYHILPRPDGVNWDGMQYFDKNTENEIKGVVFLFKPTNAEGENKLVKLKGVDENISYQLTFEDRPEQNGVYTGRQLLDGISVNIGGDMGSEMIWITFAK